MPTYKAQLPGEGPILLIEARTSISARKKLTDRYRDQMSLERTTPIEAAICARSGAVIVGHEEEDDGVSAE